MLATDTFRNRGIAWVAIGGSLARLQYLNQRKIGDPAMSPRVALSLLLGACLGAPASAQNWASMEQAISLSEELPDGPSPGQDAYKAKLLRLTKTPGGNHDGRLVVVYADANGPGQVWAPRELDHVARDVFARYSDDEGQTWSAPVNLSNSANSFSATTDSTGDGVPEPYWGDCGKPTAFSSGDNIVVSWVGKYCPPSGWIYGASGAAPQQGTIAYPDLAVFPNSRVVPYAGVYAAISNDGGTTWVYGDTSAHNPPVQITYGRRDAIQDSHRGAGNRWIITWQEDPEGLQPGEADGPGDGASGAKATKGTDIWYTYTDNLITDPLALRSHRTPLSNHSAYDVTATDGYPTVGTPGSVENHWATRANAFLLNDNGTFKALVAYEESKGLGDIIEGKTIQYHAFPFNMPIQVGAVTARNGSPGATLTEFLENSRRVRFVAQTPNGVDPAICIFWKQGVEAQGAPSDILLKTALAVDEAAVTAAPTINISANTPNATAADLGNATSLDPLEDAQAHRALMRGSFIAVGYSYTPNQALARYTTLENYDFWLRRSFDGGLTWDAPVNMTQLDKSITVKEPRIVGPPNTGTDDSMAFTVAFGTETNVYEGIESPTPLDIRICRTQDAGQTFSPPMILGASELPIDFADPDDADSETQVQVNEDVSRVFAIWMAGGATQEARFTKLTNEWFTPGDKLRVTFTDVGDNVTSYFDALLGEVIKLRFQSQDGVSRVQVDVRSGSMPGAGDLVKSFTVKASANKLTKELVIPVTGRYHLSVTHIDKGLGPIRIGTGRLLPKKAQKRKLTLAPDPATLTAQVPVLALAGSLLQIKMKPGDPFTGPPTMGFFLPDGTPFDTSAFMQTDGDVVLFQNIPLAALGEYVVEVSGFSSANERLSMVVDPIKPPKIFVTLTLP